MHLLRHPDTSSTCRLKLQEALIKKLAVVHSLFYVFRITLKDEAYTKYNLLQRINIMGLKKAKNPNLIQISYKQICAVVTQNKDKFKTCCSPTQLKKRRLLFQCPSGVPESRHLHLLPPYCVHTKSFSLTMLLARQTCTDFYISAAAGSWCEPVPATWPAAAAAPADCCLSPACWRSALEPPGSLPLVYQVLGGHPGCLCPCFKQMGEKKSASSVCFVIADT